MTQTMRGLRWLLFGAYVVTGALALMIATPIGLKVLGLASADVNFLPARILGLPWTLSVSLFPDGPVTALAVMGVGYALNVGIGLMLARTLGE